MDLTHVVNTRLITQHIAETKLTTAKQLVSWMGAMQAQDYAMAKWAIGVRLPNSKEKIIESALTKGDILRTHVLRPTWHLVSADDIYWLLELTAPHIKSLLKSRNKELELSETIFTKSHHVIVKALTGEKHLTREELACEFEKANIVVDSHRMIHLMLRAELDGIVCSGITKDNKQTYALLSERVPHKKTLTKEEALAELAKRYFSSHGLATLHDFIWWSGLPVKDAKHALELIQPHFFSEVINSKTYWYSQKIDVSKNNKPSIQLLPAFDEFIISYRERIASLPLEHHQKVITSNGIFKPVIILKGQVIGTWKRTLKKDTVHIDTHFFQPTHKTLTKSVEKAAIKFGDFLNKKTQNTPLLN